MNPALTFDISNLIEAPTGSTRYFSFRGPVKFDDINVSSGISGKLQIMRIEGGVNAKIDNIKISVGLICEKCLKSFKTEIFIATTEREFLFKYPSHIEDLNDLFLIDQKKLTIDLSEPLRQEIILHFPLISVCSKSCKGLCPYCGKNRNKQQCNCTEPELEENKPLSILKDLLK